MRFPSTPPQEAVTAPVRTRLLSRGNRTEVFLVVDPTTGAPLVEKRLRAFANVSTERRALAREAFVQAGANTRGVVEIIGVPASFDLESDESEFGETDVIYRHFVSGQSAAQMLVDPGRKLDPDGARFLGASVANILSRVHDKRLPSSARLHLVHRDVTPGNILIETNALRCLDGGVWLNDFGLAHVPSWGPLEPDQTLQGTRGWLAPELESGEEPTGAADVFQAALFFAACLACTKTSDPVDVFRRDFPSVARQLLAGLPSAAALDENPKDRPSASELERALLAG